MCISTHIHGRRSAATSPDSLGITHFDDAFAAEYDLGHLRSRWTMLGEAAGCETVGVRRIELKPGGWSTPAHEHGRSEEIFYVLAGSGISWQRGQTAAVRAGDAILYRPRSGTHSVHSENGIDLLAFGTREFDESARFPQLGMSLLGGRAVDSVGVDRGEPPIQFTREAAHGAPELPSAPGERPPTIANIDDVEAVFVERPRVVRTRRNLGRAIGSRRTGLQHVLVEAGKQSAPLHCHSVEEEIFVILAGEGQLLLGDQEIALRPGNVVARPAGTGIAHAFRAGAQPLTYLAYGSRDPSDVCYYPRSNKLAIRGVNMIARLERLDYWDGED
jgi:uncharacterized cupin superfamily protein